MRNSALDGLRGIAAVSVIFYHSILHNHALLDSVLVPPLQSLHLDARNIVTKIVLAFVNGNSAVLLFFVLSGFVLKLSLDKMDGNFVLVAFNFTVRRCLRLYPALFFCMAVFLAFAVLYHMLHLSGFRTPDFAALLQNALLINITWHGASATIQGELFAIPFLLAFYLLYRLLGYAALMLFACYSVLAIEMPALTFGLPYMTHWLFAFAAGMLVAHTPLRAAFSEMSDRALWVLVFAFVLCRLFISLNSIIAMIGQILLASFLVGSIYYGSQDRSFMKFLHHPYVQFLGKTSYSLYLLNVPLLWVALSIVEPFNLYSTHALEVGLLVGALVTIATCPIAYFSYRFVEQGGIELGTMLTRKRTLAESWIALRVPSGVPPSRGTRYGDLESGYASSGARAQAAGIAGEIRAQPAGSTRHAKLS